MWRYIPNSKKKKERKKRKKKKELQDFYNNVTYTINLGKRKYHQNHFVLSDKIIKR